jgi:dual specificity phosphatase 12
MQVSVTDARGLAENSIMSIGTTVGEKSQRRQQPLHHFWKNKKLKLDCAPTAGKTLSIDLYQPLAVFRVVLQPDETEYRLKAEAGGKSLDVGLSIESLTPRVDRAFEDTHMDRQGELAEAEQKYLERHGLVSYWQGLLHAVIKVKPKDPYRYMLQQLSATVVGQTPEPGEAVARNDEPQDSSCSSLLPSETRNYSSHQSHGSVPPHLHAPDNSMAIVPTPLATPKDESEVPPAAPKEVYEPVTLENCDQIIPGLFLGAVTAASDRERLVAAGIRAVVCCCREMEYRTREFHQDIAYYRVDVEDVSREPIEEFFPEATEFIHSWLSREQKVLVHCRAGVSRSASVVLAYLVEYLKYSLHDAIFLARSHRPVVTPNLGFMSKLIEYEEEKRGTEATVDMCKYTEWYDSVEKAAVPDLSPD